jgi:hypothetical protein
MRLIYFPNNFTIHSSTPSTYLGFIGSITNHYMLPERKCEFNTPAGRGVFPFNFDVSIAKKFCVECYRLPVKNVRVFLECCVGEPLYVCIN